MPGKINADFADIRTIMQNSGSALMGVGVASGENRAVEAAKMAISSPLLDVSINGAKGILFTVAGGDDVTLFELQEAAKIITESIDPEAKVIFGTIKDEKMKKSEIKITVIACGFSSDGKKSRDDFKIIDSTETKKESLTTKDSLSKTKTEKETTKLTGKENEVKTTDNNLSNLTKDKKDSNFEDDDWSSIPAFLRRSKTK